MFFHTHWPNIKHLTNGYENQASPLCHTMLGRCIKVLVIMQSSFFFFWNGKFYSRRGSVRHANPRGKEENKHRCLTRNTSRKHTQNHCHKANSWPKTATKNSLQLTKRLKNEAKIYNTAADGCYNTHTIASQTAKPRKNSQKPKKTLTCTIPAPLTQQISQHQTTSQHQ